MFTVLSPWHCLYESSSGTLDECSTSAGRPPIPLHQTDWLKSQIRLNWSPSPYFSVQPESLSHFTTPQKVESWVDLGGWLRADSIYLTADITHRGTNRARCGVTSLIRHNAFYRYATPPTDIRHTKRWFRFRINNKLARSIVFFSEFESDMSARRLRSRESTWSWMIEMMIDVTCDEPCTGTVRWTRRRLATWRRCCCSRTTDSRDQSADGSRPDSDHSASRWRRDDTDTHLLWRYTAASRRHPRDSRTATLTHNTLPLHKN